MFLLTTDPTVYPIQSVDLRDAASLSTARVRFRSEQRSENRDLRFPRVFDGGENIVSRLPQAVIPLRLFSITGAERETLEQMKRTGPPIYVGPNYDEHTILWAPLSQSTQFLKRTVATDLFAKTAGTYSRASVAYYLDKYGLYQQAASGAVRYMPSVLGKGIVQEMGYGNLADPAHPANGNLGWVKVVGSSAAPSWSTEINSIVQSKGGVCKIVQTTGSPTTYDFTFDSGDSTTAGDLIYWSTWFRGDVTIATMQLAIGATTTSIPAPQSVSMDGWTRVDLPPLAKTDATTTFVCTISISDPGADVALFIGPTHCYKGAHATQTPYQEWTDQTSPADDDLSLDASFPHGERTITCEGIFPDPDSQAVLWEFDTTQRCRLQINANDTMSLFFNNSTAVVLSIPNRNSYEGLPFWACARLSPSSPIARLDFYCNGDALNNTDGSAAINDLSATSLQIGRIVATETPAAMCYLQDVRVDARFWSQVEVNLHRRLHTERGFIDLLQLTTGGKFTIDDIDLPPIHGRHEKCEGTLVLRRYDVDTDLAFDVDN